MPIYSEALRIYRDVYGSEHPSIAEILLVVAGFQNTFMNDMQQYIEHINTRWAYDVKTFRYVIFDALLLVSSVELDSPAEFSSSLFSLCRRFSKAQRVAAAQYVLDFVIEKGLLDIQVPHCNLLSLIVLPPRI